MALITTGTVSVTQGSSTVTGVDTLFITDAVAVGDFFQLSLDPLLYVIASIETETSLTLQINYAGATASDSTYQILTDFYSYNIIKLFPEMKDSFYVLNKNFQIIANQLAIAGASAINYQITQKFYIGEPVQNKEFGQLTFDADSYIHKITLSTDLAAPVTDLVLDIAINDVYQSLDLTLPAFSQTVASTELSYALSNNDIIKFKWKTVGNIPGNDYFVDITWYGITALGTKYDFTRYYFGELQINAIIGNGYYPPTKSGFYALSYELSVAAQGSAITLELLKNGVSLGTPIIVTIPENSSFGKLTHSTITFETTDSYSWKVTQLGSVLPGENLSLIAHSYKIE